MATVQTVTVGQSAYVNSTAPNTAPTQDGQLHSSNLLKSLLKFTLPVAPTGLVLQKAELQLRTTTAASAGAEDVAEHTVSRVTTTWAESTVTWNTAPAAIETLAVTPTTAPNTPYRLVLDKAKVAAFAAANPGGVLGLMVATTSTDDLHFWSSRYSVTTYRPVLVLTYDLATSKLQFPPIAAVEALASGNDVPTVTTTAQSTSTIAGAAALIAWNTPAKIRLSGGNWVTAGTVFPDTVVGAINNIYPRTPITTRRLGHIRIVTTEASVEFQFKRNSATAGVCSIWVKVNGKRVTATPVEISGPAAGGRFVYKLVFPTAATREIEIRSSYLWFGGVFATSQVSITAPAASPYRAALMCDSFGDGSLYNIGTPNGTFWNRLMDLLGCSDGWNLSIGGTGFVAAGTDSGVTTTTFTNRLADLTDDAYEADVIFVAGGTNDRSNTQSQVQTAAAAFFSGLVSGLSTPREIYNVGCWDLFATSQTAVFNVDEWTRQTALANGIGHISSVTGNVYSPTGALLGSLGKWVTTTAQQTAYVGGDNTHPTDAGHAFIATKMRQALEIATGGVSTAAPTVTANVTTRSFTDVTVTASPAGTVAAREWEQTAGTTLALTDNGDNTYAVRTPAFYGTANRVHTYRFRVQAPAGQWSEWATWTLTVKPHKMFRGPTLTPVVRRTVVGDSSTVTPWLPFNMPSQASLAAITGYLTGTHSMQNYTWAVNNTAGLTETTDYWGTHWWVPPSSSTPPSAASAVFSTAGTYVLTECRDRPIPRAARAESDWKIRDHKDILRSLTEAGFDFVAPHTPNTGTLGATTPNEWDQVQSYLKAAAQLGTIKVALFIDGATSIMASGAQSTSAANLAALMNDSTMGPAFLTISGRKVFIAYNPTKSATGAENGVATASSIAAWRALKNAIKSATGNVDPYFWASYQSGLWTASNDTLPSGATETFGQIMDGLGNFGGRDPVASAQTSDSYRGAVAAAAARGSQPWMAPCSMQAVVPRGNSTGSNATGYYWESVGFGQLLASFQSAFETGAPALCWNTMNDFPEGSHIGVSRNNKRNLLDIVAYLNVAFKTRSYPVVVRPALYVANRRQLVNGTTTYTSPQDKFQLRQGSTAATDVVDVLSFANELSDVTVTTGGISTTYFNVAVGMQRLTTTARLGEVTVVAKRAGTSVVLSQVTSRFPIQATLNAQDLAYYVTGSLEAVDRPAIYT